MSSSPPHLNQAPSIRLLASREEAEWCAQLMATSEPWITLGRDSEASLRLITDLTREPWVAEDASGRAGFIVLALGGPLSGYVQSICVAHDRRSQGIGTALLAFAERRIFARRADGDRALEPLHRHRRGQRRVQLLGRDGTLADCAGAPIIEA